MSLPDVARGEICGDVEVTIDRGGLTPPLRYEFRGDGERRIERDTYAVEARVTDYNADRCWVALRVTRLPDGVVRDFVLRPEVEHTVTHAGAFVVPARGVSSPDMKDPFGSPGARADVSEDRTSEVRPLPRPATGISSADLCDPFGVSSCERKDGAREQLSVVVTVHRTLPSFTAPEPASTDPAPSTGGAGDAPFASR